MELSKDAVRILRWLCQHDQWHHIEEIEKNYKHYEYRAFSVLKEKGFVETVVFDYDYKNPEFDEYGNEYYRESYRVSDAGKAYIEGIASKRLPEVREWIAICTSVIALVISVIALFL